MKAWNLLLRPLGWLYGLAMALRNFAFDKGWRKVTVVQVPVISIGNITVGGTGKTPMAEFLLEKLLAMGLQPAYLSRGYGRNTRGYLLVKPDSGSATGFGDEAYQVASKFPTVPVAVCEDRVTGANRLQSTHPHDVLVLDDAFQHRKIGRKLDWVMVDVSRFPLDDHMLPAGRLREPLGGLGRGDAFILTKFPDKASAEAAQAQLQARFPGIPVVTMGMVPKRVVSFGGQEIQRLGLESLAGKRLVAFSGLGNNQYFADMVQGLGAEAMTFLPFPDHHPYQPEDLEKILSAFGQQPEIKGKFAPALILTTEKDYFRLRDLPWVQKHSALPWHYLEIGLSPVSGWETLEQDIKNINRDS